MNKFKVLKAKQKKALLLLVLSGSLTFMGCNKENVEQDIITTEEDNYQAEENQNLTLNLDKKYIDDSEIYKYDLDVFDERSNLYELIKNSSFSEIEKEMLKEIVSNGEINDLKYISNILKENDIKYLCGLVINNSKYLDIDESNDCELSFDDIVSVENTSEIQGYPSGTNYFVNCNEYGNYKVYQMKKTDFLKNYIITYKNEVYYYIEYENGILSFADLVSSNIKTVPFSEYQLDSNYDESSKNDSPSSESYNEKENLFQALKLSSFNEFEQKMIREMISCGDNSDLKYIRSAIEENDIKYISGIVVNNTKHLELDEFYNDEFKIDNMVIFDNSNGKTVELPKHVCFFVKCGEYGNFKIYQMRTTYFEWKYIVVYENKICYYIDYNVIDLDFLDMCSLNCNVIDFNDYLKNLQLDNEIKPSYSVFEIKKLMNDISQCLAIDRKYHNVYILDTTERIDYPRLNKVNPYYIIIEKYPYAFDNGVTICEDINNSYAFVRVSLDSEIQFTYEDYLNKDTVDKFFYMDSEDDVVIYDINSYLKSIGAENKIKKSYTKEDLIDILEFIANENLLGVTKVLSR